MNLVSGFALTEIFFLQKLITKLCNLMFFLTVDHSVDLFQ